MLRIRSLLDQIRIRPTDFRPDPDPACNITGGEKKIENTFRKSTLSKAGGTLLIKIYMIRNCVKSTVV